MSARRRGVSACADADRWGSRVIAGRWPVSPGPAAPGRGKRGRGFSGDPARPILFRYKEPLLWKPEPRAGGDGGSWVVTDLFSPGDARPRLLRECTCPPAREREFSMDTA